MSFAYRHVGAPERVLEFYEDEVRGNYFQPISATWFWHPTYESVRRTARSRWSCAISASSTLARAWLARAMPSGGDG